jgi:hypothetical protein
MVQERLVDIFIVSITKLIQRFVLSRASQTHFSLEWIEGLQMSKLNWNFIVDDELVINVHPHLSLEFETIFVKKFIDEAL